MQPNAVILCRVHLALLNQDVAGVLISSNACQEM
jgi:hypothetical protein